ncbi:hypothetical protein TNCV_4408121 [Trichonephila clavipes]|nr:hypothetical protein TNCV_4408121 [Trichonephila clavipes]
MKPDVATSKWKGSPSAWNKNNPAHLDPENSKLRSAGVATSEEALFQNSLRAFFRYGSPVSGTVITLVGGPCIIDMVVATPLYRSQLER